MILMPYVETDAGRLFYILNRGDEEVPALVLIHGAGGSRLHWPSQLRRMSGAAVYTLDLPGHGRSDGPGCDTIEGYADAAVAFVDGVALTAPVIVGHSMGGAIAQQLAMDHPDRVSGLVLVGTGARLRVAPAILRGIGEGFDAVVDLITEKAWSSEADPLLKRVGRRALQGAGPDVVLQDFTACDRFDVMDRVNEIHLPVLVIVGEDDELTPVKYSQFLSQQLPDATLVTFEGAGHMVMLERPNGVVEAIQGFVTANG